MAFFVAPHRHDEFQDQIAAIMKRAKGVARRCPAVCDGAGRLRLPHQRPGHLRHARRRRASDDAAGLLHASGPPDDRRGDRRPVRTIAGPTSTTSPTAARTPAELLRVFRTMINHLFPVTRSADDISRAEWDAEAAQIRRENGFDSVQHEQLRDDLQRGRIGLARNRLPVDLDIRDVDDSELIQVTRRVRRRRPSARGESALGVARSPSSRSPPGSAAAGRPAPASSRPSIRSSTSTAGTAAFWRSISPRPGRPSASSRPRSPTS